MTTPITCFVCSKEFEAIQTIMLHFKVSHCLTVGDVIQCKQDKLCRRKFDTFSSFKQHLIRKHQICTVKKCMSVFSPDVNLQECNEYQSDICSTSDSIPNSSIVETTTYDNYTTEDIIQSIEHQCASFCAKLYANPVVPRSQVQFVLENVTELLSNGFGSLFTKMLKSENRENITDTNLIIKMISILENAFQNLLSDKLRLRYFENSNYLIPPISYYVGNMPTCKKTDTNTYFNIQAATAHFIPLRKIFQHFMELPNVLQLTLRHIREMNKCCSKDYFDFLTSPLWRDISKNYGDGIVIPIFLFYDDFEINNPLGSHAGIHKLGAAYILLAGTPLKYHSTLDNIFLALLCHSSDRTTHGNRATFNILFEELKFLETNGIEVVSNNKRYKIYFTLTLILGDNLGVNSILGFSESFSSHFFCRFCRATKEQCQTLCISDLLLRRTKSNYDRDIQNLSGISAGVKEPCIWNDLKFFHVTKNIACDVMHDIYEGICRYEVGIILKYLIDEKLFSLQFLNERIKYFNFGAYERNRVPLIKTEHIKKCCIIISAAEMACLVRYLGLIIGDKIPQNNCAWEVFLLLKQIISIVTSRTIHESTPKLLKSLIEEHHSFYLEIFNNVTLKPKHHIITHYPEIMTTVGPLINISSMRFEAKH